MKRFGNIPVSRGNSPAEFKRLVKQAKEALDRGISLIVFAEGTRTLDGRVGPFKKGGFVIAQHTGYPIVPMSIVGSFEFHRKGNWMLYPSKIIVHLHDTIETRDLPKHEVDQLIERVHRIVSRPIEESLASAQDLSIRANHT
jgi:1-acyl-sn-glycerol-3-phosphate acyltransferase